MKKFNLMIAGLLFATMALFGADISGKWTSEIAMRPDGDKVATTFDLKASGESLTGSVATAGARAATSEITDGKITGNKFSFKTKMTTQKGESVMVWEGTIDGETLKGTRTREGGQRSTEFTAKRAAS